MRYVYVSIEAVAFVCAVIFVFSEELFLLQHVHDHDTSSTERILNDYTFSKQRNTTTPTNIITWKGKKDLKRFMQAYFHEKNLVCDLPAAQKTLINITFGCKNLFEESGLGSGNFMAGFYAIRLAAMLKGNVDVNIHCQDAFQERQRLLLPWLTGHFPSSSARKQRLLSTLNEYRVPQEDACGTIDQCPIGLMFSEIQNELRRMAVSLVGIPSETHPSYLAARKWLSEQRMSSDRMYVPISDTPIFQNVELDDVIIHFRCGDLMESQHPRFAFLKFEAFSSRISPNATSIGIVTQPFDDHAQNRAWDSSAAKRNRCKTVVLDFERYLQQRFPSARIRVHNSREETIALTYARMIMSNQTIAGISTFGVFASIASFGKSNIRKPDNRSATNKWLTNPPLNRVMDGLVLMEEPNILMVRQVQALWEEEDGEEKILSWFRDPSISYW